ncbi:hypothetical protein HanRHA438_Chr03g0125431 [Helianthus annuus]|nr:hypothetical protein HanRHA438_Chr03g0125431 [Helianthus annuus]
MATAVAKLEISDGGSKSYIPKNFYRTRESKMYIPKNFYTKTTYITLLSEKFGSPPAPLIAVPLATAHYIAYRSYVARLSMKH